MLCSVWQVSFNAEATVNMEAFPMVVLTKEGPLSVEIMASTFPTSVATKDRMEASNPLETS